MKQHYALLLLAAFGLLNTQHALAQPPCLNAFTGQTGLTNASPWAPATVPPSMTGFVNTTTTAGSTTATVASAAGLAIGNQVSGPNIPAGTTITNIAGTTITLSAAATGTGTNVSHTYVVQAWANNYPPTNIGSLSQSTCSICPATYSVPICADNY